MPKFIVAKQTAEQQWVGVGTIEAVDCTEAIRLAASENPDSDIFIAAPEDVVMRDRVVSRRAVVDLESELGQEPPPE